jgi:D-2-hydroxyacid dehydrogenase (NADP+)
VVLHERPETLWRRWTGIEPAGRGSLVPTALKAAEPTRYPDTSGRHRSRRSVRCNHEAPDPPHRRHRPGRRGRQEAAVLLTLSLFCSETALRQYGADWRTIAPDLSYVALPAEGRLSDDDIARIDLAVFTADIWTGDRGPAFFKVLLRAPNAKWLHMFAAGTDDPVFAELRRRGTRLTHSAGSSATPIAHTVIMHTIALCRGARELAVAQQQRRWAERDVTDVEGRTMGIIGLGSIGAEVARLAQHFGIRVIGVRRSPHGDEPCETWPTQRLHELLPLVDDLVLTAPLTDATRNIIGATELALLPRGAHLINIGRGQLVDEPALIAALQSRHLGGAALDVFVVEPLPADNPLWDLPNVIVTPHSAGGTPLATQRAADIFAGNLGRYLRNESLINEVT